jgi:threonine dehydrogenase-like Zn-dependent dehydrogenase
MPPVGPLDVLIKVHQSGVCGTDVHLHHGTYIGIYPLTPGHETIGEIEEVGTEVTRFQPGQRVTVDPNIYCGHCEYCLAGQLVRCANTEGTGTTAVGNICVPLTRNGGTVLVYGVTRPDERLSISPFELFRREITIKGSYAEMTSFAAAISALRTGRARTDGIISHKFPLDDYGKALEALASDPTAHKVVIDLRS